MHWLQLLLHDSDWMESIKFAALAVVCNAKGRERGMGIVLYFYLECVPGGENVAGAFQEDGPFSLLMLSNPISQTRLYQLRRHILYEDIDQSTPSVNAPHSRWLLILQLLLMLLLLLLFVQLLFPFFSVMLIGLLLRHNPELSMVYEPAWRIILIIQKCRFQLSILVIVIIEEGVQRVEAIERRGPLPRLVLNLSQPR